MRTIKFDCLIKTANRELRHYNYTLKELQDGITPIKNTSVQEIVAWREWTGLKDKNGVEIYEGDIVRDAQNGDTDEVVWNEKYAAFQVRDVEQPWHGNLNGSFFKARTEVIGNIYENKELLEDNND